MNRTELTGWERLRHEGLLLDPQRLQEIASFAPNALPPSVESELRRRSAVMLDDRESVPEFVAFVLEKICGFTAGSGIWKRGSGVPVEQGRNAVTGEKIKPGHLWTGDQGGILPVFFDREKRLGVGHGRRATSRVLSWLRGGREKLAVVTNGRQWRLVFAGLDFEAWCEWDTDLWFEEGKLSDQVAALRTLLSPGAWTPVGSDSPAPLLRAILDSRKGQAELSQVLGERVREAVEALVQSHGHSLKERCGDVDPAEIYRAAVRVVMRMVIVLFAESRDLLPRDHDLYHSSYGLTGLLESLEKTAARGGDRLARSWSAWPRVLALFRLIRDGSHHPDLLVPAYGGELFASGEPDSSDGLSRALSVFETACFDQEVMADANVHHILERITRTRIKVRQGRSRTWIPVPVDFSDLSSEYIGILYEGLLDFELRTAPRDDPMVFLAVGDHPVLPLSRLEEMDNTALNNLLKALKDTSDPDDGESPEEPHGEEDDPEDDAEEEPNESAEIPEDDERHNARLRAETWAVRAVRAGALARRPRGTMTPEKRLQYEETVSRKARQLIVRVVLPGGWYLVRWGGTRKGSGSFYTRPGLAVPTVQRTLQPLAYEPAPAGTAATDEWIPRLPEEILDLKICDPACGSGSFPVATLRFLTDALYASLHRHGRIAHRENRSVVGLLTGNAGEDLCEELLPCPPDDGLFEPRLKAVLRRHVVERCLYGVDLDPLAVELCRLALWVETMDRELPFSFLDHKIKCGNNLVGAWFDEFQHYPVMAWKNREGGDKTHSNGVHFEKDVRTKAIKAFVKDKLTPDLAGFLSGPTLFSEDLQEKAISVHDNARATLTHLHALPVHHAAERARTYYDDILDSDAYRTLSKAMDLWCACWFWPGDELAAAPLPSTLAGPLEATREVAARIASRERFFHWEIEFPDVFREANNGFDAMLGNPPWDTAKPYSKEFFSNIDPLYRSYGKQEALSYQTSYFKDEMVEREWLTYNAGFRALSNFVKYRDNAFGDPSMSAKNDRRFMIVKGHRNRELHTYWRHNRSKSLGYVRGERPYQHQGSGDINRYKLFLEQAHALLKDGGRLGFIVPSGLYSDHGTGDLRKLFLHRSKWEWIFAFENRDGIFDIHRSMKFNAVIVEKGGKTQTIRTAFMRRRLEDWEGPEFCATDYARDQIDRLSPRSQSILEIESSRDLETLDKIYGNSVLLGENGPGSWSVTYSTDFHTTDDSRLFPPRPKWEELGYRPDEYNRWLKGAWKASAGTISAKRADNPERIVFSRDSEYCIEEGAIEGTALPVYSAKVFNLFDFSSSGWVRGKGRGAVWRPIDPSKKTIEPEYLMSDRDFRDRTHDRPPWLARLLFKDISTAVHHRTMLSALTPPMPAVHAAPCLTPDHMPDVLPLQAQMGSFVLDFVARLRIGYLHLNYAVIEEFPLLDSRSMTEETRLNLARLVAQMSANHEVFSPLWIYLQDRDSAWREQWASTLHERLRLNCMLDAIVAALFGLSADDLRYILRDCDLPVGETNKLSKAGELAAKGFWRVDKDQPPELRHTVLTLVAFDDLQRKISEYGDIDKGVAAFCGQNDGDGWMFPESLRLADYGLGCDERAREVQKVRSCLGPRFFDWQLGQDPEESWRECHLHARNLLGKEGYAQLLATISGNENDHLMAPAETAFSPPSRIAARRTLFD